MKAEAAEIAAAQGHSACSLCDLGGFGGGTESCENLQVVGRLQHRHCHCLGTASVVNNMAPSETEISLA